LIEQSQYEELRRALLEVQRDLDSAQVKIKIKRKVKELFIRNIRKIMQKLNELRMLFFQFLNELNFQMNLLLKLKLRQKKSF